MKIAIINGPNLNLIGSREPDVYGGESFEHYFHKLRKKYETIDFDYYQSNVEGELINEIQSAAKTIPVVEVHISNIEAREEFRKYSHITSKCSGTIFGFGLKGYLLAVESFLY